MFRSCLLITFLFIIWLAGYSYGQSNLNGIVDLRNHNFQASELASLAGNWEFYYGELLYPTDFRSKKDAIQYLKVPGSWKRQGDFPVLGYGTYRCQVILGVDQRDLLLYISNINSASKIWINGVERAKSGIVSSDPEIFKAELSTIYASIPEQTDTLEIVIQVANFAYFSAGISSPRIGLSKDVIAYKNGRNGIENFFAGILIAMFVYQIILYLLHTSGKPNLWLALICLGVALRGLVLSGGSFFLPGLFPDVSFEIWKKIEFGSIYLIVAIFPLYIHHLFRGSSSKIIVGLFCVVAMFLFITVLLTPQYVYGLMLEVCHIALLLSFVYAFYTIAHAWRHGNLNARIIFFGVIASFPFIILEILKNSMFVNLNVPFAYLVELGVLVFLLFQVYILARHYSKSFKSLEVMNRELEAEVIERTSELVESNDIKDRLLSVISHDVKSPLNSLQGLISIYRAQAITREEFEKFMDTLEGNLGTTNALVENILYWTASQRSGEDVKSEQVDIEQIVNESIGHVQGIARQKGLEITHDVPGNLELITDRGILHFTLRNLISNAIKFSHPGGNIHIYTKQSEDQLLLTVQDSGIGMSKEQIKHLFDADLAQSTVGTKSEKGTGLGLGLCRKYLHKIGAEISVSSETGKGSRFSIILQNKQVTDHKLHY